MKEWIPPCMNEKVFTQYPDCKTRARDGKNGTCSIFVALGCHGYYISSDVAKSEREREMKDKSQNLIALVIFLMAVGFVLYVAVAKGVG